jgi:hypothetical protein
MRRREFIALLGGAAAAAWPIAARAQQPERLRHIGVLVPGAANDPVWQTRIGAFQQALALSGWIIGRNVRIDIRWATTDVAAIRREAEELAALAPDVTLAAGHSSASAFAAGDPYGADRVRDGPRCGCCRLRRQPRAAGRQRHWVHVLGIQHGREVAGTARSTQGIGEARRAGRRSDAQDTERV